MIWENVRNYVHFAATTTNSRNHEESNQVIGLATILTYHSACEELL
jgi:hypothetical protein